MQMRFLYTLLRCLVFLQELITLVIFHRMLHSFIIIKYVGFPHLYHVYKLIIDHWALTDFLRWD